MNPSASSKQQRLWSRAESYSAHKQWRQAVESYDAILAHAPDHLPALLKSSAALLGLDRYRDARQRVLEALALANDHPGLVLELCRKLRELHEAAALMALIERSGFVRCGSAPMLTEMALIVSSVGDQRLALELVSAAVAADAAQAQPHYLRGTVLMFLGRMAEAEAELESCIAIQPTFPQAHWVLSRLRKWTDDDHHLDRLQDLRRRALPGSEAEAYFCNALHNELHDLKRYDESWEALDRCCRIKQTLEPYPEEATRALFAAIKERCSADFLATTRRVDDYRPIFIVGMHRSGTTLLERILGGHTQVADGGETYAFTAQLKIATDHKCTQAVDLEAVEALEHADFDAIGRGFIDASRWRTRGKPFLTEKLPPNLLNAGFIAKALPNARILHMVRDPIDTCFSNLRTYFTNAALYSFDQEQLAAFYLMYADLMAHWRQVMPNRVLDVSYDRLVTDTDSEARRIFAFCGMPFEADALAVERPSGAVSTASSAHVRAGILTNRGAAWKPYEAELEPLLARLRGAGLSGL